MRIVVTLTSKNGQTRQQDGFTSIKDANDYGELEKSKCPDIVGYAAHVVCDDDDDEKKKKRKKRRMDRLHKNAELGKTHPDETDGHIHEISTLDEEGNGKTGSGGTPPHSHDVMGYVVLDMATETYRSMHKGEVLGANSKPGDAQLTEEELAFADEFKRDGGATKTGRLNGGFEGCVASMMRQRQMSREDAMRVCQAAGKADGQAGAMNEKSRLEYKEKAMKLIFGELKGVEIFATGTHRGRKFEESDIDRVIENFRSFGDKIKPPMVLGHDEEQTILQNSGMPSLGWVTALSKVRDGAETKLIADFEDVPDSARTVIQRKAYKRISSELYDDFEDHEGKKHGLALRRVAILGADIPEVKTLEDVNALSEMKGVMVFAESSGGQMKDDKRGKGGSGGGGGGDDEVTKKLAELADQNKQLLEELAAQKKANQEIAASQAATALSAHREAIKSFCEELKTKGKLLPKWQKMGLQKFMETIDSGKTMKFSEEKDEKPTTGLEFFKEFLRALPEVVKLEELAATNPEVVARLKALDTGSKEKKSERLHEEVVKFTAEAVKAGRKLSYGEALNEVAKLHPELVELERE